MQKKLKISAADKEALLIVKSLLDSYVDEIPSLKYLCKKSGLNRDKIKKGFSYLYGLSIRAYHIRLRMEVAKDLLLNSEKTIEEIAQETGYMYRNNFCIAFKRATGQTPLAYRSNTC